MTPKEKAFELFDKYMQPIDELHKYPMCFATAKKCALIAVDEVIEFAYNYTDYNEKSTKEYWQEVKKEIELL